MVTVVEEETAAVDMVKEAVELPAGTITEAGTVAAVALLLDKLMAVAPAADPVSVTVA